MQIREQYIESFKQITTKYPFIPSYAHIIPENITLTEAIGYANKFIIDSEVEHFRYDYYREFLDKSLTMSGLKPKNKQIVHLDLGCGPGLFSWVIQDYMVTKYGMNSGNIEHIGYDHAENMIRLAVLFKEHIPAEYNFEGYSGINSIRNILKYRDFSRCHVIITFGHVLIQVKDNPEALRNFAEIINNMFPSKSCNVVAVDAYKYEETRQEFKFACRNLVVALDDTGVNVQKCQVGPTRSWMCARLSNEQ